jgi:hypothetical protein
MSDEDAKLVKNLDRLLFEDIGEEPEEVRRRLEAKGVDVKGLIARVKAVAGDAYREALRDEAAQEQRRFKQKKGSIFGDLAGLGREKLIELIRAVQAGEYGKEVMARCRNQQPEKLSETDLRTFLEDIESTAEK